MVSDAVVVVQEDRRIAFELVKCLKSGKLRRQISQTEPYGLALLIDILEVPADIKADFTPASLERVFYCLIDWGGRFARGCRDRGSKQNCSQDHSCNKPHHCFFSL